MAPEEDGQRFQLRDHERRIERLEKFEPAVMTRQLTDLDNDVREVKAQLKWQTRALIGAMITMLGTLAVVLLLVPHG